MTLGTTRTGPEDTLHTAAEVAEVARVSRAAVSNWRRRFSDFPQPVAVAPGGGDLFRYGDVESWLRRHDRWPRDQAPVDSLWRTVDSLRGAVDVDQMIDIACAYVALLTIKPFGDVDDEHADENTIVRETQRAAEIAEQDLGSGGELFEPLRHLAPEVGPYLLALQDLVRNLGDPSAVFEQLLDRRRRLRVYRSGDFESTSELGDLLVRLAEPSGTVFDPAVGEGGFLLGATKAQGSQALPLRLLGQEINHRSWRIARLRFIAHGIDAEIQLGDSLAADSFEGVGADVVLCDPPFGQSWKSSRVPDQHKWFAGVPGETSADLIWVQHVINHLAPEGRGYVILPNRSLFAKGREGRVRAELLRRGCVEAIVALPGGLVSGTSIPVTLWIVRPAPRGRVPYPVLLVDASGGQPRDKTPMPDTTVESIARVLKAHRRQPGPVTGEDGFATAVDVIRLLDPDATLVPAHWLAGAVSAADLIADVTDSLGSLVEGAAHVSGMAKVRNLTLEVAESRRPAAKIRDLIATGALELFKGRPIPSEALAPKGTPVLISPWSKRGPEQHRHVSLARLKGLTRLTEPGDVVVVTVGDVPRAFVDTKGGHVLPDFMQSLRIKDSRIDPVSLAALLSAPSNRRFVAGTTIPRVSLSEVEIPLLSDLEVSALREMVVQLTEQEEAGEMLRTAAADTRGRLLDALVSGEVLLTGTSPRRPKARRSTGE